MGWLVLGMGGLGLFLGMGLSLLAKLVAVPGGMQELVREALPGSDCGACGFAGCGQLAAALLAGEAGVEGCRAGGREVSQRLAQLLQREAVLVEQVVFLRCCASAADCPPTFKYRGMANCRAAHRVAGGARACHFGCLGFGDCVPTCPTGALALGPEGMPVVDRERCTGCGLCVKACPRDLLTLAPRNATVTVRCVSLERGPRVRATCRTGCLACGLCVRRCAAGALRLEGNLALVDQKSCTGCGDCVDVCPPGTIRFVDGGLSKDTPEMANTGLKQA